MIKIYQSYNTQLLKAWKLLWKTSQFATLSNSPEWYIAAVDVYKPKAIQIVALYSQDEKLIGIGGFIKKNLWGVAVWGVPADEFSDKESILIDYSDKEIVIKFFSSLPQNATYYLTNYMGITLQHMQPLQQITVFKADTNLYIDFLEGLYGNLRQRKITLTNNRLKNNTKDVSYDIETESAPADRKLKIMEIAFDIEKESSKTNKGKSSFYKKSSREFYKKLVTLISQKILMILITVDRKPIAYSICFINNNVIQGSQKAHLSSYNYFSPGSLLVVKLCDYARSQQQTSLELGRGIDSFKKSIATRTEDLYTVIASPNKIVQFYLAFVLQLRMSLYKKMINYNYLYKVYKTKFKKINYEH